MCCGTRICSFEHCKNRKNTISSGNTCFYISTHRAGSTVPLHLFVVLLLSGLSLHLLHLDGVRLPPPHVQLMVPHTQRQDALVDPQPRGVEHKVLEEKQRIKNVKNIYIFKKIIKNHILYQHLLELFCQWAWWQTSCRWRKYFWSHSRGNRSLVTTWGSRGEIFN